MRATNSPRPTSPPREPAPAASALERPRPPDGLADEDRYPARFRPAPDVAAWLRSTFIDEGAPLVNPDHAHLALAVIDVLWTNVGNQRQMRSIVATAEMPMFRGSRWAVARQEQQVEEWFGRIPDFLLTFDAVVAAELSDTEWCAIVEHELYHCAQALDDFGCPKFRRDSGMPVFAMRGHDVEEFVGVVARYGPITMDERAFVNAAADRSTRVDMGRITAACGTCQARAA